MKNIFLLFVIFFVGLVKSCDNSHDPFPNALAVPCELSIQEISKNNNETNKKSTDPENYHIKLGNANNNGIITLIRKVMYKNDDLIIKTNTIEDEANNNNKSKQLKLIIAQKNLLAFYQAIKDVGIAGGVLVVRNSFADFPQVDKNKDVLDKYFSLTPQQRLEILKQEPSFNVWWYLNTIVYMLGLLTLFGFSTQLYSSFMG